MSVRPGLSLAVLALLALGASAADAPPSPLAVSFPEEDEAAILRKIQERGPRDQALDKAVAFLLSQQQPDASFGQKFPVAMTALAVMALMSTGRTPDDPTCGTAIRRGMNYVLSQMREDGYLGQADGSRMYGHGICTLMLAEAVGMTRDEVLERRLAEGCRRAVKVILAAQALSKGAAQGGWRYEPNSTDSDLSLTGWNTMALRAAKNIGIDVPKAAIESAVKYIRGNAHPNGGFGYVGPDDAPALRGIGLLALAACGAYDAPELAKTTARMLQDPPRWQGPWFYYRTYYAAVGMYQMGDEAWDRFYPLIDHALLGHQNADGSWSEPPGNNELSSYVPTPVYSTAMATLALAVHHHLLPVYQR